jgi:hypothetical protein
MVRGKALLQEGKWVEAMKLFQARLEEADAARVEGAGTGARTAGGKALQACISICQAKMGLDAEELAIPDAAAISTDGNASGGTPHPLQHLAAALSASTLLARPQAAGGSRSGKRQASAKRVATSARAAGHAVAYLLHPGTQQLPSSFIADAFQVLASTAPLLLTASGRVSTGDRQVSRSTARKVQEELEERAESSKALQKLVGLVGLVPVKKDLLDLAARVGGHAPPALVVLVEGCCVDCIERTPACDGLWQQPEKPM